MGRASPADIAAWLRRETPHHLELLTQLRGQLAATMHKDVNEFGTPSRDWCRAMQRYGSAYQLFLIEERERFKLRLLMARTGDSLISEEEYEQEIKVLAVESLGVLPEDMLHREIERRRALAPALVEREDVDD